MPKYFEQIQDYVEGQLAGADLAAFEKALTTDAALEKAVTLRKNIQETLTHQEAVASDAQKLNNILQEKRSHFFSKNKSLSSTKIRPSVRWGMGLAAAASIALILFLSGVFNFTDYSRLPNMPTYAVRGNEANKLYEKAASAYNRGNYGAAIGKLSQLTNSNKKNATVDYFLGLSYLGKKAYQKAILQLTPIASGTSIYHEEANYYLGYAFYKLKDTQSAKTYLQKVPQSNSLYAKARKLTEQLEK